MPHFQRNLYIYMNMRKHYYLAKTNDLILTMNNLDCPKLKESSGNDDVIVCFMFSVMFLCWKLCNHSLEILATAAQVTRPKQQSLTTFFGGASGETSRHILSILYCHVLSFFLICPLFDLWLDGRQEGIIF